MMKNDIRYSYLFCVIFKRLIYFAAHLFDFLVSIDARRICIAEHQTKNGMSFASLLEDCKVAMLSGNALCDWMQNNVEKSFTVFDRHEYQLPDEERQLHPRLYLSIVRKPICTHFLYLSAGISVFNMIIHENVQLQLDIREAFSVEEIGSSNDAGPTFYS